MSELYAERTLTISPSTEGEFWEFLWCTNPLTRGLTDPIPIFAHVSYDGDVSISTYLEDPDIELLVNEYIKARYNTYGVEDLT